MLTDVPSQLEKSQLDRLRQFSALKSVDIHCHCLPGLDDGPENVAAAVSLCRSLVDDGITTVIATPHQLGAYEGSNSAASVRQAVKSMDAVLKTETIPLAIVPGADVRVDDQLLSRLDSDEILTLADSRKYILLELPGSTLVNLTPVIRGLADRAIIAVISHPERQPSVCRNLELLVSWLKSGAVVQITAGSLLGEFGASAEKAAWDMLASGLVSVVASDAHDVIRRPPAMTRAIAAITNRIGHAVARKLCLENPRRILDGESMLLSPLAAMAGRRP